MVHTNMTGNSRQERHGRINANSVDIQLGGTGEQITETVDMDSCLTLGIVVWK